MNRGLELSKVNLSYGDGESTVFAMRDVWLTVEPGELVAIVGPSGAGKSSLLAVAGALTTQYTGSVTLDGTDYSDMNDSARSALRRSRIGFVFQSGNLIPALNVTDQLWLSLDIDGKRMKSAKRGQAARIADLLEAVGMSHRAKAYPHQLSGGERQRVGIARALVNQPALLLVDEPTAALDRKRSQEVVALLARQAHDQEVATVMVTHDHDVLHHCDRVIEMVDGELTDDPAL